MTILCDWNCNMDSNK